MLKQVSLIYPFEYSVESNFIKLSLYTFFLIFSIKLSTKNIKCVNKFMRTKYTVLGCKIKYKVIYLGLYSCILI